MPTISALGQWQLIDNFDIYSDGDIFTAAEDIGWHATAPHQTDEYWMLADPFDPSNVGLYVEPGGYGTHTTTWLMKELPGGGIAPGETGTLYFRCLWAGADTIWHMGTTDKALAFDKLTGLQTAPGEWDDFNALIRMGETLNLEHRDGGDYVPTDPQWIIGMSTWYQFWMVIENSWDNSTTLPTSTGVHTLYVQGAGFGYGESPTLVSVGTDPPKDSAALRRAPVDEDGNPQSIIWAMFSTGSSPGTGYKGPDPYILDDFYFSPGKNLSVPQSNPCEDCPDEFGNLDTGDWMGWINVSMDPFLWSYSLNGWIYMEQQGVTPAGGWGYFYK